MRKAILAALILAASFAYASDASAVIRQIGFVTSGQLKYLCGKNGGSFYDHPGGHYSCSKDCGKKSGCTVSCNGKKKTCEGNTPTRTEGDAGTILGGGYAQTGEAPGNILGSSGTFAPSRPGATGQPVDAAPKAPAAPIPQIR